jgi:hypothetical protein
MTANKTSSNPHGLTVGQSLFFVFHENRHASTKTVTVRSIGRRWANLDNNTRIDMANLRADGGGFTSPGSAYLTEGHYREEVSIRDAWDSLSRRLCCLYSMPAGLTVEKMDQIAGLLGIDRGRP